MLGSFVIGLSPYRLVSIWRGGYVCKLGAPSGERLQHQFLRAIPCGPRTCNFLVPTVVEFGGCLFASSAGPRA